MYYTILSTKAHLHIQVYRTTEPSTGGYTSSAVSASASASTSTPMGSRTLPVDLPLGQSQTASLYETKQADDELCP